MHLTKKHLIRTGRLALLGLSTLVLHACSNEGGGGETAAIPAKPQIVLDDRVSEYAKTVTREIGTLDNLPEGITLSQISLIEGVAKDWTFIDNEIRFLSPNDPGKDSEVKFKISFPDKDAIVAMTLQTRRELAITQDGGDSGPDPKYVDYKLLVTGFDSNNRWLGGEITVGANKIKKLSPELHHLGLYIAIDNSGNVISLKQYAKLNAAKDRFIVSAADMQTAFAQVPYGEFALHVVLTDADDTNIYTNWDMGGIKPTQAVLKGQLIDITGAPVTTGEGKWLAIRGMGNNNGTRQVVQVQAGGKFTATNLTAGGYNLELLDVANLDTWLGVASVFDSSTDVAVKVLYDPAFVKQGFSTEQVKSIKASAADATGLFDPKLANSTSVLSRTPNAVPSNAKPLNPVDPAVAAQRAVLNRQAIRDEYNNNPNAFNNKTEIANPSTCASPGSAASSTVYTASGSGKGVLVTCGLSHSVPKGTQKLGLQFTVFTSEFPTFTQQKSEYNDTWAYFVNGVSGVSNQSGVVNDTHYTTGSISKDYCIDVSAQTKEQAFQFSAGLSTANIGDGALATIVRLTVTEGCAEKLKVVKAEFEEVKTLVRPLIGSGRKGKGNLLGEYISIPVANSQSAWGIPLTVTFEPKKTTITKVRVGVMVNGAVVMGADDVSGQISSRKEGELKFSALKIPRIGNSAFAGKTNVLIELTGTDLAGTASTSEPEDGKASYGGVQSFTPLFLATETITSDARKYGGAPDAGGDSWSRKTTIDWLQARAFRFNDISALHVKQTASGRSVLDHAGHSDGTQIDLRYADGSGGYSETLGGVDFGSAIAALFTAAQAEVTAGGTAAKPNLVKTLAWIAANRSMIEEAAPSARKIYVGNDWLYKALNGGKFSNQDAIPGIGANNALLANGGPGAWVNMPGNVDSIEGHLNHWHISLAAD
jgi:hypothetical protein